MSPEQGLAFAVLGVTITLFAWGRLRYDMVALLALLIGLAVGVVPFDGAFHGFGDPVVVVIAAAMVVSAAIQRSGLIERLLRPLALQPLGQNTLTALLVGLVTGLSAFMKNVGALAIFIPAAFRLARRNNSSASLLLMPMSFGSLVGGLMTLIGTSPNIIISRVRADLTGHPYAMFDYFPVGLGLSVCAVLFLSFAWRLLPKGRETQADAEDRLAVEDYLSEVRVEADSAILGSTVADLEQLFSEGSITVAAIIRDQEQRYIPGAHWKFLAGDILLIEGDPAMIKPLLEEAGLTSLTSGASPLKAGADLALAEAVVLPGSQLVGSTPMKSEIRARHGAAVLAVRRAGRHFATRLQQMELRAGDVLVIEGAEDSLPGVLADLGCLPLADRGLPRGRRQVLLPVIIAGLAMTVIAAGMVPVAVGFFAAAVLLVLFRCIPLREAYEAVNWPIILMLAALIPVSDAMKSTGASELVAAWLVQGASHMPAELAVTLVMVGSMLLAPFLHHAPTVLVMGPIAAGMAGKLGLKIDPFLMAVAVGAGCDFLTPIGHQCNTLVMGPGGYRFGDYWRLGLPLSLIVTVVGTVLIELFWPLR